MGYENLKKPQIQDRIAQLQISSIKASEKGKIATPEEILEGLTQDHRFDPGKLYDEDGDPIPVPELPDDVRLSLAGHEVWETRRKEKDSETETIKIKYKYKHPDKVRVRDLMAKLMGLTNGNSNVIRELLNSLLGVQVNIENLQVNQIDYQPLKRLLEDAQSE
jgi:hypothetical protein